MRHEPRPVRPEAVEAEAVPSPSVGAAAEAVVAAEAEEVSADEFEQHLIAGFGPVDRWFIQPDGLRLPLP